MCEVLEQNYNSYYACKMMYAYYVSNNLLNNSLFLLDWRVLSYILKEIPQVLKNKALILSGSWEFNPAHELASTLCSLVCYFLFY